MPFFIVSPVIQALLIVHCIKTGRNQIWIRVRALLSFAGIIAYIAAKLLPDLRRSRTGEYKGLTGNCPGTEARVRSALLPARNQSAQARTEFRRSLKDYHERKHYLHPH